MSDSDIPELLRPSDYAYYTAIPSHPRAIWPDRDTVPALRKSLDKAHDNLRHLVSENDRLRSAVFKLHRRIRWLLKVFIALMLVTWSAFAGIVKFLLPYAIQGMQR